MFNKIPSSQLGQRLLMIAPFFLWGSAMVAMRDALTETTPLFIAVMRLLPAGILVLGVRHWQKRDSEPSDRPWYPTSVLGWMWILLFAVVDGTCFQGFLAWGLADTGAGLGSVMIDSQPLAVALMASWFYQERLGKLGWISLGIGLLGLMIIGVLPYWSAEGLLIHAGIGWMALAALSMAVGTVMIRQVCRYADPVIATGWHMVLGSLPLIWISATTEVHQWDRLSLLHWLDLGYAAILGSALAYGLFFYFASRENLAEFSSLTFLTPVFALVLGGVFLQESLSGLQWCGVGVTLISVYLINTRKRWHQRIRTWLSTTPWAAILDSPDLNVQS